MIQQEKILFVGGLNSDDEDRFLADGDYRYALNIRNSKTDQSSVGAIENVRGNTEILFTLPNGINECIGSKYDAVNNRVIFFIWNYLGNHGIYELELGSQTVNLVMHSSVFNFNRGYPILHCEIIDDLCYWTDEYNPERKINISRAKSGGYTTIDEQVISRIQYAPNYSPAVVYGSDINVNYNKVRNKIFQFRYAYIYDDNEISSTSPISKITIPQTQAIYDFSGYYPITDDNYIAVTLNTGIYLCKRIQVFVRESNTADWYLVKELDKSELNIGDNTQYTYNFYNNETYIAVTQAQVNKLFDNVPLKTGAISLVDGNRLVSSDITEGFDNIEIDATATAVYNPVPPAVTSTVASSIGGFYSSASQSVVADSLVAMGGGYSSTQAEYIKIDANTVNATDVWNFTCLVEFFNSSLTPAPTIISAKDEFTASFPVTATSLSIATYFANAVNTSTKINGTTLRGGFYWRQYAINNTPYAAAYVRANASVISVGSDYAVKIQYYTEITFNGSGFTNVAIRYRTFTNIYSNIVVKTFKNNSRYSASLVYLDSPNRSGVAQVSETFELNTNPYSAVSNRGNIEADITINHTPPSWAKYYQVLFTENRSVSSYLQIDTGSVVSLGSELKIYINTIEVYNTLSSNRSSLAYSFAKGDRVTFIKDSFDNFYNEYYDTEVLTSSSDGGGQFITVRNILPTAITNGALIELYTPKLAQEQVFYWEVGEVYPITGGYHIGSTQNQTASQPAIIRVNSGDSYYRYRGYNIVSFITDTSLSDWYVSNSWDKGRFNVVDKEYKQIRRYATSYYSESYIPDTNINGLSTVYDLNFHEANKTYGAIQKTYAEQDRLYFFQELRTGFSLVNKDVLYNSDGTPNGVVGQASQVLSDVQYYIQDYGIGAHPESFAVDGTRKYHIDANKGLVLRLSIDGYTEISDYKYRNYFQDMFNARKEILPAYLGKIWGVFDRRFGEYVLAFDKCKTQDQIIITKAGTTIIEGEVLINSDCVSFSEEKKRWVTHYSFNPDFMQSNGIDIITWTAGKIYLHNSSDTYNNFYGVQYNSQIEVLSNEAPSNIKFYTSVYEESTDSWSMVATNQFGQETSLLTTDFELNEGVYYAGLLKDANTPNVSYPLIEGDDMRCHSMTMVFTNTNTGFVKMFAVTVRFGFSEMTNK